MRRVTCMLSAYAMDVQEGKKKQSDHEDLLTRPSARS